MSKPNNKASIPESKPESKPENNEVNEGAGKCIATYKIMDKNNQKDTDVLVSQGVDKAVEFMFKHPESGEKMDYATMRYYYG